MNDIEQRIADSLKARAALVTDESLRGEQAPTDRHRRWPALAVAAAVVGIASVVGVTSLVTNRADDHPPAQTISPAPPTTTSEPPTTTSPAPSSAPSTGTSIVQPPPATCGGVKCTVLQTVTIGGDTLELLASPSAAHPGSQSNWKVRVRGGAVAPGAKWTDNFVSNGSLTCQTVARRSVCLVHTAYLGDSDAAQGLIKDSSGWRFTGATFGTPYGALRVDVRDLAANGTLEVVAVEQAPNQDQPNPPWTARVWRWDGSLLGCTPPVPSKEELPGWPTVTPDPSTLKPSNCLY